MNYSEILSNCNVISIYLGNECNFNCEYCDRDYISTVVGGQGFSFNHQEGLFHFLKTILLGSSLNVKVISFHGGEPFLYVKRMDSILTRIQDILNQFDLNVLITTNGSLIEQNEWFIKKWGRYLTINCSYDFIFQKENRSEFDIHTFSRILKENSINAAWQFVMSINENIFTSLLLEDILSKSKDANIKRITLIPLRHHRGEIKFTDFFSQIDLNEFDDGFRWFIDQLETRGFKVIIDGNENTIDKNYMGKHYKIILSPDGNIYTEYDFCEYKRTESSIGKWYDATRINFKPIFYINQKNEDELIPHQCVACEQRDHCGIKFLYKIFNVIPSAPYCNDFYKTLNQITNDNIAQRGLTLKPRNSIKLFLEGEITPKQCFVQSDHVNAVKNELVFSIFKRYNCFANCHICYVKKDFETDKHEFNKLIPKSIPLEQSAKWVTVFNGYDTVGTIDDLYYLKHNHTHLFNWYREHSSLMEMGSLTDNAFFRTFDILMNDIPETKGISEITFSNEIINKVNLTDVLKKIEKLHKKSSIKKMKFVVTSQAEANSKNATILTSLCKDLMIPFSMHSEILNGDTISLNREEQIMTYATENGKMYIVLSEADYLQYDSFFLTIRDAISNSSTPYDILDENFSFTGHVVKHLHAKQDEYVRYSAQLSNSVNPLNVKYREYFNFVGEHLVVNNNANFIPSMFINKYNNLYRRLRSEGWSSSRLGLVRNIKENVIPLFEFKK